MPSSKPTPTGSGPSMLSPDAITLIEALPGLVLVADARGDIHACNEAAGNAAASAPHPPGNLNQLLPEESVRTLLAAPDGTATLRAPVTSESGFGPSFEWTARELGGGNGLVVITGRDLSREDQLLDQVVGNQWFETSAAFAGGLAHNFNNKIAAILGLSEIIGMRLPQDSPMREFTDKINITVERTKPLVKRLSQSCRKRTGESHPEPTAAIVEDLSIVLSAFLPGSVVFECTVNEETPWSRLDRHAFEHILLNCVLFARHRLRETGGNVQLVCGPESKKNQAIITLKCSGKGFQNLDTSGIFELDLSPTQSAYESGSAMHVARLLAETGGMTLTAQSNGPQSIEFALTLPPAPGIDD